MSSAISTTTTPDQKKRGPVFVTCSLCGKEHLVKGAQARRAKSRGMHSECYLNRYFKKKKHDEKLPKYGSIAHWPEHQGELVPITCGVCKKRHMVKASGLRRGRRGLHIECYDKIRKLTGSTSIGKEGSIFHHKMIDPADPNKRGVTCGRCKKNWYSTRRYGKALLDFPGICHECKPRQHAGEIVLPKGTKAFLDIDKRVRRGGASSKDKVWIECRGCFKNTGELKLVWLSQVTNYVKGKDPWDELCSDCVGERGCLKKFVGIKITDNKTEFHFHKEKDKPVAVIYGKCRHPHSTTRLTAISNYKKWPNICPECKKDPDAYLSRMQELAGKALGADDAQTFEREVEKAIGEVWSRMRSVDTSFDKQLRLVTGIEIAAALHLGSAGTEASADQLRKKLERHGVRDRFAGAKRWFPEYVRSVIEKIERPTGQSLSG